MTQISAQAEKSLIRIFLEAKGLMERFVLLNGENPALEELFQAKLISLEIEELEKGEHWYAALTDSGLELAQDFYRKKYMVQVELSFDTGDASQARLVEQLANLSDENVGAIFADLFALHEALQAGDIDTLMGAYPELSKTIQQMIRAGVDSQLMAQEQHRINHLLGEIGELKTLLAQQTQQTQQVRQAPARAPINEDDVPIPAPAPQALRPVLPHSPQGQPKQLTVPQFDVPSDDEESEDLFVVQKDEDAGKRASENFLQSLQRLQK